MEGRVIGLVAEVLKVVVVVGSSRLRRQGCDLFEHAQRVDCVRVSRFAAT